MIQKSNSHVYWFWMLLLLPACGKTTPSAQQPEKPKIVHTSQLPAGWYAQQEKQLHHDLENYLKLAKKEFAVEVAPESVKALIVPHAGHYYSGLCAASAYQTLLAPEDKEARTNQTINRVIILAPSHTHFFNGVALPYYTQYKTVMGTLDVDEAAVAILAKQQLFKKYADPHLKEHAIEIQLPFLQKTIKSFTIVPLIVGHIKHDVEYYQIADELKKIINDKTLVVISSDFVHHGPNYDYALFDKQILDNVRAVDSLALQAICSKSRQLFSKVIEETNATICGREPLKILLALLEQQFLGMVEPRLTCSYTSAQIPGARDKEKFTNIKALLEPVPDAQANNSVSYLGMVFTTQKLQDLPKEERLTMFEKKELLTLARRCITNELLPKENRIEEHLLSPLLSPGIEQKVGAFVTLNSNRGALRGCIGRIVAPAPLYQTVAAMSKAAAFQDTRFKPVQQDELASLVLDISILSAPEKVAGPNSITLGKHGVILTKIDPTTKKVRGSAVFLPQVPPSMRWNVTTTLEELGKKAGLDKDAWKDNCEFDVFEGFEIKE